MVAAAEAWLKAQGVWKVNLLDKFGGSNIRWGLSESPLVLSDRILVMREGRPTALLERAPG